MDFDVSIIMPVHNAKRFIDDTLKSLNRQTYQNYEVILVDDGSSDDSGNICEKMSRKDNRFIVIHQNNAGAGTARNAGLMYVTGEWVAFLDSDDLLEPYTIQLLLDYLLG